MPDRHRTWRTLALLAAASTTMAACSKSSTSSSSAASRTLAKERCPAGITIGFFGPLTGDSAHLGLNQYNGMKLALSQFNKANPDCQVDATHYDSEGSPDRARARAQQAIDDKKTVALIGPALVGECMAADPLFNDAVLPTVTASATSPALSRSGWKIFHRAVLNDRTEGLIAASYITRDLAAKRVAVIDDGSEYGKGIADVVRSKVSGAGATVTSDQLDPNDSNFSSSVNKVKGAAAEAVFFGGHSAAAGLLAKQLKDGGVAAKFVAPDGADSEGFVTAAGQAAAEGAILTAAAAPIDNVPGGAGFSGAYRAASGQDPGFYAMEAYDAANAILDAIKNGATTRRTINDYLGTKTDWVGLTKEMKFDSNGELYGTGSVYAYQVSNGKLVDPKALNG